VLINQVEIHRKSLSSEVEERREAVEQIRINVAELPDKEQAWADLLRLTKDKDIIVKLSAASSLGHVFSDVPDKKKAWTDLLRVTKDEDRFVRFNAVLSLGVALHCLWVKSFRTCRTRKRRGLTCTDSQRTKTAMFGVALHCH
jgi:hypothetical protein